MTGRPREIARAGRRRRSGFTLVEALVSITLLVMVMVGMLQLFDFHSRVAKAQTEVAIMQQSQRLAQSALVKAIRGAGRGSLPLLLPVVTSPPAATAFAGKLFPRGVALEVLNQVPVDTCIVDCAAARVLPGTDVLITRGVLSTTLHQAHPSGADFDPLNQTITVRNPSPTGIRQDLTALRSAIEGGRPEALLLTSPLDDALYVIVELDPDASTIVSVDLVTLAYKLPASGSAHARAYMDLTPGGVYPVNFDAVAAVGIVEEVRHYVRDDGGVARFSLARLYPNTDQAWDGDNENLRVDMVDDILDLQIGLGIDTDADGVIAEDGSAADEWLFNNPADEVTTAPAVLRWNGAAGNPTRLFYVRVSTLARTERGDVGHVDAPIDQIEDRVYAEPANPAPGADTLARMHRRRLLLSLVDLRNLS